MVSFIVQRPKSLLALNEAAQDFRRRGMTAGAESLTQMERKIRSAMRSSALRRVAPDLEALLRAELIAVQAGPRPKENAAMLLVVRNALLSMKALRFVYFGGTTPGATRNVAPYGIIFGRMNYLIGPELETDAIKNWRLDRMHHVEILDHSAAAPEDFSLSEFAASSFGFFQGEQEDVVLRVLKHGADDDFANWQFHPKQVVEQQPDGTAFVKFRASGMLELAWHLFSWGNKIEIVAPDSLRELMLCELRKGITQHEIATTASRGRN